MPFIVPKNDLSVQWPPAWKVVQSCESNRKGNVSRWRTEAKKKEDMGRKRMGKRRNKGRPHVGVARGTCGKGVTICGMMKVPRPKHQGQKKGRREKLCHTARARNASKFQPASERHRQGGAQGHDPPVRREARAEMRDLEARTPARRRRGGSPGPGWAGDDAGAPSTTPSRRRTKSTRTMRTKGPGCW